MESVYANALDIAVQLKGLLTRREYLLKVVFRGGCVGNFYAAFIIENKVIVELTAVKTLASEHFVQAINYLNVSVIDVEYVVIFGMPRLRYRRFYGIEGNVVMRNRDTLNDRD